MRSAVDEPVERPRVASRLEYVEGSGGMALELARRRFNTAEYERMAEAGVLGEDDRLEP